MKFGSKLASSDQDQSFKSLQEKTKEIKQNAEFETQRKDAILEATSGAVKKVFGGGLKVPTNLELKEPQRRGNQERSNNRERVGRRNEPREKTSEGQQQKPVERISLFQFLEEKLPDSVAADEAGVSEQFADFNRKTEQERRIKSAPNSNQFNKQPNRYERGNNSAQNFKRGQNAGFERKESNFVPRSHENNFNRGNKRPDNFRHQNTHGFKNTNTTNQFGNFNQKSVGDVEQITNGLGKMNVNAQFASRSLKQHLNLNDAKADEQSGNFDWKVGDSCLAKYWEDGKVKLTTYILIVLYFCLFFFSFTML